MYEPEYPIDPELYPYLVRWGLSMGYRVEMCSDDHDFLDEIRCLDHIRGRELHANGAIAYLNREEADDLVEHLETVKLAGPIGQFDPLYHPTIKLDADMYDNHFMPEMKETGYRVYAKREGTTWHVLTVASHNYDPTLPDTDAAEEGRLCRSEVTGIIRDLEHERRMSPFLVTFDMKVRGAVVSKRWLNGLDELEQAQGVLAGLEVANSPEGDFRIYADVTAAARNRMTDEFAEPEVLRHEGWLWLRIWHPGEDGADWWHEARYSDLEALLADMTAAENLDMYGVTAIYASILHRPPTVPIVLHTMPTEEAPVYKVLYWSSRKKGDISEPYGEVTVNEKKQVKLACLRIMKTMDIYRLATWKRLAYVDREIVVEEYHGNQAHLSLKNSRMEGDE